MSMLIVGIIAAVKAAVTQSFAARAEPAQYTTWNAADDLDGPGRAGPEGEKYLDAVTLGFELAAESLSGQGYAVQYVADRHSTERYEVSRRKGVRVEHGQHGNVGESEEGAQRNTEPQDGDCAGIGALDSSFRGDRGDEGHQQQDQDSEPDGLDTEHVHEDIAQDGKLGDGPQNADEQVPLNSKAVVVAETYRDSDQPET